jgi:hypothetical protein
MFQLLLFVGDDEYYCRCFQYETVLMKFIAIRHEYNKNILFLCNEFFSSAMNQPESCVFWADNIIAPNWRHFYGNNDTTYDKVSCDSESTLFYSRPINLTFMYT